MKAFQVLFLCLSLTMGTTACSPQNHAAPQTQADLISIFETAIRDSKRVSGHDPRVDNPYLELFFQRELALCHWNRKWVSLSGTREALGAPPAKTLERWHAQDTPWPGTVAGVSISDDGHLLIGIQIGYRHPILLVQQTSLEDARSERFRNHQMSVLEYVNQLTVGETVFFLGDMSGERRRYSWRYNLVGDSCEVNRAPRDIRADLEQPVIYFRFHSVASDPALARRDAWIR